MATRTRTAPTETTYFRLVRQFPLRPIRNDAELDRAIRAIDSLIDKPRRTRDEEDYLDVLGNLVEAYEDVHYPMNDVSDAAMLRHLIEARAVTQAEVAKATGIAESTISAVLSGKRKLSRTHIGKLARYFHVSPDVFAFDER